jgi:hypothetical protein
MVGVNVAHYDMAEPFFILSYDGIKLCKLLHALPGLLAHLLGCSRCTVCPLQNSHKLIVIFLLCVPCLQPPKGLSTAKQSCNIVIEVSAQSFISNASFPCSMAPAPFEQLGSGCCYNPPRRLRSRRSI